MAGTLGPSGTVKVEAPAGGFEVGAVVAGRYRLLARLGEGAYGQVFKACHMDVPEHKVALKLMGGRKFAARDAEQEMRRLASVAHPNVVQLADHGLCFDEAGAVTHVWFTMPLYDGGTLRQRVAREPLSLRDAHAIFVPVARGLAAMHAAGLRHQDVKPDNLFLADVAGAVHPLVLDLGVATDKRALTPVAGTFGYAAPEHLRAIVRLLGGHEESVPLTEAIDTYGLAVTLREALLGAAAPPSTAPAYALVEALPPRPDPGQLAELEAELLVLHEARRKDPLPRGTLPAVRGGARDLLAQRFRGWLHGDPARRASMTDFVAQLDALLEPERRSHARQRALAVGAGVLAAGGLAASLAVGYARRSEIALSVCRSTLDAMAGKLSLGTATLDECKTVLAGADDDRRQCHQDLAKDQGLREAMAGAKTGCTPEQNTSYSRLVLDCRKERDGIRGERDDARAKLDATGKERDGLRAKLDATGKERDDLRGKLDATGKERDDLKGKLDGVSKDRDALKARLDAAEKDREGLKARLDAAGKEAEAKVEAAGKERDALKGERQKCEVELVACRSQPRPAGPASAVGSAAVGPAPAGP